jgi:uncharacterized protein (DUF58 family)
VRTGAGWLATAVLFAVVAATVASLALFALAVGLTAVVAVAFVTVLLAERRVTITRSVVEREGYEDRPLLLRFRCHGLGRIPVQLEALGDDGTWTPLDEPDATVPFTVGRRGAHLLEPSVVRLSDILGIFHRLLLAGEPEPVLLLPAPDTGLHVPFPPAVSAEDVDPDGLRPYVPGSPVSRIHWASLARGRDLHERRLTAPPVGLPLVVVDTAGADDPAEVDWVARAAAGCLLRLARTGGCKVLLPGDTAVTEVTDAGARNAVHRRLAHLDRSTPSQVPSRLPVGAGPASVVRFPAGMVVAPPPPLPPGVVPLPPEGRWQEGPPPEGRSEGRWSEGRGPEGRWSEGRGPEGPPPTALSSEGRSS